MIVVLLNVYLALLFILVKLKVIPFNLFWKISPAIVFVLLMVGLFIPMSWGAPQGPVLVVRNSVAIVPDVAGEVIDVPAKANQPLKAGDVLFRIDPVPFQAQVDAIQAQLSFQETRLAEMSQLQARGTGRTFDVEERQASVDQLKAQLVSAKWNLEKTTVRAPADGYVTNLALRKGARVATSPVMAFIDTSDTIIGAEINQIDARYIVPGQAVEATLQIRTRESLHGQGRECLAGDCIGADAGLRCGGHTGLDPVSPFHSPHPSRRSGFHQLAARGGHRRRRDLHQPCHCGPRDPPRPAPPDRNHQLRQPF